jgi:uncharacterized phage protein gp47/JayE
VTVATLDATGLSIATLEEIRAEIDADQRADIDATLDPADEQLLGQLNGIVASRIRETLELQQLVYNARAPGGATFAALDNVCAITGTRRDRATKGTVTLTLTVTEGNTVPAGSVASVDGQAENRWVTLTDAVGVLAPSGDYEVEAEAETAGAIAAPAGTITTIATPTGGWLAVTNALDAEQGTEDEEDPALRLRREEELARVGSSPLDAIRAELLDVADVTYVRLYENVTDTTDGEGLPPHSVEAVVLGGTDDDVALALWQAKAGGIRTHGTTTESITDTLGESRTVKFTRPADVEIYLEVTVVLGAGYAGDPALKAAVVAAGLARYAPGDDVKASHFYAAALAVTGVTDVAVLVGITAPGALLSVTVDPRELARFDTSRVTVVS